MLDDSLIVNGQVWSEQGDVTMDAAGFRVFHTFLSSSRLTPGIRSEMDYFEMMFPVDEWDHIVTETNQMMLSLGRYQPTTKAEVLKYLGLRLCMALERKHLDIAAYWNTEVDEGTVFQPENYGSRFGMSRNRFQLLSRCFRVDNFDERALDDVSILYDYVF